MTEIAHPLGRSIFRGLRHRCPACGEGRLFSRYLKVEPACARCGRNLAQYRADDGPAYLTIVLVGHLLIAPLLFFPVIWRTDPMISLPILLSTLAVITLVMLSFVKGGWIGLMYSLDVSERDAVLHTADLAD